MSNILFHRQRGYRHAAQNMNIKHATETSKQTKQHLANQPLRGLEYARKWNPRGWSREMLGCFGQPLFLVELLITSTASCIHLFFYWNSTLVFFFGVCTCSTIFSSPPIFVILSSKTGNCCQFFMYIFQSSLLLWRCLTDSLFVFL